MAFRLGAKGDSDTEQILSTNAHIFLDNRLCVCAQYVRRYQMELIIAYNGDKDGVQGGTLS